MKKVNVDLEAVVMALRVEGVHAIDCLVRTAVLKANAVCSCWVEANEIVIFHNQSAPKAEGVE